MWAAQVVALNGPEAIRSRAGKRSRLRRVQRGQAQIRHRLLPLRHLHLDHRPAPRRVVVGAITHPYPIPTTCTGNSWFHPDRGLVPFVEVTEARNT
jgi:hypothetical protein